MSPAQSQIIHRLTSYVPYTWFRWRRLPSLLYWRIRITDLTMLSCSVTIPYRRSTQNPFGSIYFAALAGAAELSTGALILVHAAESAAVSMLVVSAEMSFTKKAKGLITFTCMDGQLITETIARLASSGDTASLPLRSVGVDTDGDAVCTMLVHWSLKRR